MIFKILDKNKKVLNVTESKWQEWVKDPLSRIVKQQLVKELYVSTVFLDVGNYDFETMVFDHSKNKYSLVELYVQKYETYKAALEGHNRIVKDIKLLGVKGFCESWCS